MSESRPGDGTPPASVPPSGPAVDHFHYQEQVRHIAVACANAVNVVAAQAEVVRLPGELPQSCDPQVFQWSVEKLWRAVAPLHGGDVRTDPFAFNKVVRWPGLRPARGKKREWIRSTSYHRAAIHLASALYKRLAFVAVEQVQVDWRPYFDDAGSINLWAVPEYRDFGVVPWPLDLARLVLAEAREADPVFDVSRFQAAIEIETNLAVEQIVRRQILAKQLVAVPPTAVRPPSPALDAPSTEATAPAISPEQQAGLALMSVYTNGIADDRIQKARAVLQAPGLSTNEKLTRIDELLRLPSTASAEDLGAMCGVTKQAIWKTKWWQDNRAGEKDSEARSAAVRRGTRTDRNGWTRRRNQTIGSVNRLTAG